MCPEFCNTAIDDDGHTIGIAQSGLLTNQITGRSPVGVSDLTVLPYIGTEPVALAVRAESPYRTLREFTDQLKKDPASLSVSVGSSAGTSPAAVRNVLAIP